MTDAFYAQYRCRCILLLSAIYEQHYNIVNLIFVSCCHLANTNENEYNHCCYLYSLGCSQLCKNFELNSLLVTLTFDILTSKVVSESRVTWATSVPILVFLGLCSRVRPDVRDRQTSDKSID